MYNIAIFLRQVYFSSIIKEFLCLSTKVAWVVCFSSSFLFFSLIKTLMVQVICKPGTVKTHSKFEAEVYILTKEEGGRHTAFFSNYRPQFYLRTADVTGKVELPEHIKMVMPGDNLTAQFELIIPCPLEAGISFF